MNIAQIYSAAPFLQNGGQPELFKIKPFEVVTAILGVERFKKNHLGTKASLYTDEVVAAHLDSIGILGLWDEVNYSALKEMDAHDINHSMFWAASKVFAYKEAPVRTIFFDFDFILWKSIYGYKDNESGIFLRDADVVASHFDYVDRKHGTTGIYDTPKGYSFPEWVRSPSTGRFLGVNASFLQINNKKLKDEYTTASIEFMIGNPAELKEDLFPHAYMCLAEQNFLLDAALNQNATIAYLAPYYEFRNYSSEISTFYHIGENKKLLSIPNSVEAISFRDTAIKRITMEAPQYLDKIKAII